MVPKTSYDQIEFFVIEPIFKTKTKNLKVGNKSVKNNLGIKIKEETDHFIKEAYLRKWMDKKDISMYGQYIGSKGEINKSRSEIYNKTIGKFFIVAHNVEEIKQVLHSEIRSQVGFKPDE